MKVHPLLVIIIGLFFVSIGFNIVVHQQNQKLIEQLKEKPKVIIIPVPVEVKPKSFT